MLNVGICTLTIHSTRVYVGTPRVCTLTVHDAHVHIYIHTAAVVVVVAALATHNGNT